VRVPRSFGRQGKGGTLTPLGGNSSELLPSSSLAAHATSHRTAAACRPFQGRIQSVRDGVGWGRGRIEAEEGSPWARFT
jgi:hypothetical protein